MLGDPNRGMWYTNVGGSCGVTLNGPPSVWEATLRLILSSGPGRLSLCWCGSRLRLRQFGQ